MRDQVGNSEFYKLNLDRSATMINRALEDYLLQERVLSEYDIDTVIHRGAQTQVTIANRNPLSTFESNIKGTRCLMEATHRNTQVERIVVASSNKAYASADKLPYTEETAPEGTLPYDLSKACAERINMGYAQAYALNITVTRCRNFNGGGDLNFNRIILGTTRSVLFNQTKFCAPMANPRVNTSMFWV